MSLNENVMPPKAARAYTLRQLWGFLRPYRLVMAGAGVALTVAGSTFLVIPAILRFVIDKGLEAQNADVLNHSLILMLLAAIVLAAATYGRYTLVSWLGERVVADLRRAAYAHILQLSPAFSKSHAAAMCCRGCRRMPAFCRRWSGQRFLLL